MSVFPFLRLSFILGILLATNLSAQDSLLQQTALSSMPIDTTRLLSDQPVKSPWGAVLRSAIIPGLGQVYTHNYLKGAAAFTLNGFWIGRIWRYQRRWSDHRIQADRDRRNDSYWFFGVTYLLTLVDAYVNAYLFEFDKAMELTWHSRHDEPHSLLLNLKIRL